MVIGAFVVVTRTVDVIGAWVTGGFAAVIGAFDVIGAFGVVTGRVVTGGVLVVPSCVVFGTVDEVKAAVNSISK